MRKAETMALGMIIMLAVATMFVNCQTPGGKTKSHPAQTKLLAPTGLTAALVCGTVACNTVANNAVELHWTDNSNFETGYLIERRTCLTSGDPLSGIWTQIGVIAGDSYRDSTLDPLRFYLYRVSAVSPTGHSGYSGLAGDVSDGITPAAPINLQSELAAAGHDNHVLLSWDRVGENVEKFRVLRALQAPTPVYAAVAEVLDCATAYADADSCLEPSATYRYQIAAANGNGQSSPVDLPAPVTMPDATAVPALPGPLTATAVPGHKIDVTFVDAHNDKTGYRLERSTNFQFTGVLTGFTLDNCGPLFSDTPLSANTHYYYRVKAFNALGYSPYSNIDGATTPP